MPDLDFLKQFFEFQQWFSTEEACTKFLIDSRWPDGFVCPRCKFNEYYWKEARHLLQCKNCGYQVSPTAGTVMHRSRQPLTMWFYAAYLVTTHTPRFLPSNSRDKLDLIIVQTAFTMLHKLRASMVRN